MAKKVNVFITGVSGLIGQKIVERFSERNDIGLIIGIDIVEPPCYSDKIVFIKHDVRNNMVSVMSRYKIDWAIHAAFVVPVLRDKSVMEDIDINGTRNFFNACGKLNVRHVIHLSSTTAYGAHKDNPSLLTEECELRGNEGFTYGKSKSEIELGMARNFMENNPERLSDILCK